jgi:dipeptidyl aminopeptidase/acylaminoacyl peptidase
MLGTRVADSDGYKLYVFAPGEVPRQIYKSQNLFSGPSLSHDGEIVVIASTEGTNSLDTRLIAWDLHSGEQLAELWDGKGVSHSLGEFAPRPGDLRILTSTSKSGYDRPMIWDPSTGARRELFIDEVLGEVEAWHWSRDANQVLLSQLYQARRQLYLYDLETDTITKLGHPTGLVGSYFDDGIFTDENEILITWQDPIHPACLIALDGSGARQPRTILAVGDVPAGRPWKPITFTSENGDEIHGWLAVPEGEGPFPTIFYVKGGPTSVLFEYYYPESQAWLDHGFAFFSINYHGSPTFGKEFEKAIIGQLGELEVQDMAAGYQWLVENGIAQPEAVFLTGDSYGGYLTLQAMGKRPELWAGGIAGLAIADWTLLYEDESDGMRGYQRVLFGGTPEEKPEAHKKSSPITYAEQIQAPILVIQGSNDSRCPARQMQVYEAKLKSLGKEIDVHWFEAGHGSHAQEQQLEHQELRLRFVYHVLAW